MLHVRRLARGRAHRGPGRARRVYVHVVRGDVRLDGGGAGAGDAARITDAEGLELPAAAAAEC